jgi:phage tail-like protein
MTTVTGEDPLIGYSFAVDLSGKAVGYFTEVSGIGSESEVAEQKVTDPSGRDVIKKIPGRLKFTDITLKRGITSNMDFYNWRKAVEDGQIQAARVNATITMYNVMGAAVARWNLTNAWPTKISGPSINAGSSEVGIEELTITYDYMERAQ